MMKGDATPTLSIVIPLYNEEETVTELVERCVAAAEQTLQPFELVLVDDHSSDGTWEKVTQAAIDSRVAPLRLDSNQGQSRATRAGLARARGHWLVILDGDLQDPPELIPTLWQRAQSEDHDVIFATKGHSVGPWWFQIGQQGYHMLQSIFGSGKMPAGGGSYCLVRNQLGKNMARCSLDHVNMAAALAVQTPRWCALSYEKQPRIQGQSRVGFLGLAREAVESLVITGASEKIGWLSFVFFSGGALIARSWDNSIAGACFVLGAANLLVAFLSRKIRQMQLGAMEKDR